MKTSHIVILLVVLAAVGGGAYYWFVVRPRTTTRAPLTNPQAKSAAFAPPVLPPKIQPQGSPNALQNLENQAVNLGFQKLNSWLS